MNLSDLIGGDPRIRNGEIPCIVGTGVMVSDLLWAWAAGLLERNLEHDVRYRSRGLTMGHVRAAAAYAAGRARFAELSRPAQAKIFRSYFRRAGFYAPQASCGAAAGEVLDELASGSSEDEVLERHPELTVEGLRALIAYGAAAVDDVRLPAAVSKRTEDSFLRDRLGVHDRGLIEELYFAAESGSYVEVTPERELEKWRRFVEQVEATYDDDQDEYRQTFRTRDALEVAVSMVSPPGQRCWREALAPLDERFYAATRPARHPSVPIWGPRPWWWHRVPIRAAGQMERYLQETGT
jgi:uncharacterized protein (DUF433 family)